MNVRLMHVGGMFSVYSSDSAYQEATMCQYEDVSCGTEYTVSHDLSRSVSGRAPL